MWKRVAALAKTRFFYCFARFVVRAGLRPALSDAPMTKWLSESVGCKRYWLVLGLCWLVLLAGCTAVSGGLPQESPQLTIFAASSLTDAFTELGAAFTKENDAVNIFMNFAGSSQLAVQLQEGAAADIFASANETQMAAVVAAHRIQAETVQTFATNRLSLIVPVDNPAGITALADLAKPDVQLILALPGVPVRDYTDAVVQTMDDAFQEQFYANLVSEGVNVRQIVAQIALGEADAGIVYRSDVTPGVADSVRLIPLPEAQNVVALYPIGLAADAPQPALAQQFIDFTLSAEGQAILARWGFGSPTDP